MIQSKYLYWGIVLLIIFLFYSKNPNNIVINTKKETYINEYGYNNSITDDCNSCSRKRIRHNDCGSCRENFDINLSTNLNKDIEKKKTVTFNPTPTTYYF
jgi:hypothetical protein